MSFNFPRFNFGEAAIPCSGMLLTLSPPLVALVCLVRHGAVLLSEEQGLEPDI